MKSSVKGNLFFILYSVEHGNLILYFDYSPVRMTVTQYTTTLHKPSFSESDVNMSKFAAEFMAAVARKPRFYFLLDFSKSKTLGQVLDLFSKIIYQKVSPGKT